MLTQDEREAVLARVLGDSVVQAMEALRLETRRFVLWPWSKKRLDALFDHLEDLMALQVNRVMSSTGTIVAHLEDRITALEMRDDGAHGG